MAGGSDSLIVLMEHSEAIVTCGILIAYDTRTVCAAVIDEQHFIVGKGLSQ
jgi:hypothetical protein